MLLQPLARGVPVLGHGDADTADRTETIATFDMQFVDEQHEDVQFADDPEAARDFAEPLADFV